MSKKKMVVGLILVTVFFVVYFDQKFKPENIEALREIANSRAGILPSKMFTTDGCSLWMNSIFGNDFTDICIEHDIEYWKGGSVKERKIADSELRKRVNVRVPFMGDIMYAGIRIFGHPIIPVPWRWGYGFKYPYTY